MPSFTNVAWHLAHVPGLSLEAIHLGQMYLAGAALAVFAVVVVVVAPVEMAADPELCAKIVVAVNPKIASISSSFFIILVFVGY